LADQIVEVPLSLIVVEEQPRKSFDVQDLQDLADSIREHGLLEPIILSRNADSQTFTLVVGERRFRAHKLLGMLTIRAIIVDRPDEKKKSSLRLVENLNRKDISDLELCQELKKRSDAGESHQAIAASIGKSRSFISHHLDLFRLDKGVIEKVKTGELSYTKARSLLSSQESDSTSKITSENEADIHGYQIPTEKLQVPVVLIGKPTLDILIRAYEQDLQFLRSLEK
jgi:ParB family chromosome partitioning protein